MSRFLSARFAGLAPYVPGEQPQDRQYIKLNTNESPFAPSPLALRALSPDAIARLNLYPDPEAADVRGALARQYGLSPAEVLPGNGSDEILAFAFAAFGEAGVCFPDISYGFYPVFASLCGADAKTIPLRADFSLAPEDYFAAGRTVVFANPNAPTGMAISRDAVASIVEHNREHVVVVDEAYVDFGGESAVELIHRYENLLVVQTFSKSRSLAGMRLGCALGDAALIADLNTVKFSFNPYNVSRLAALAGTAALRDGAYFDQCVCAIRRTRTATAAQLTAQGFTVLPSCANFLFAAHPALGGGALYQALKARGILVRWFDKPRLADYVRISIGTDAQMQALIQANKEILEAL